jgi:hypothetical protein
MIRFKDVTKVVLVLALCFGFAGVGNAGDDDWYYDWWNDSNCSAAAKVAEKADLDYENLGRDCKQGNHINRKWEACKGNLTCKYSEQKHEANKRVTAAFCENRKEYYKLALKAHGNLIKCNAAKKYVALPRVHNVDEL